MNFEYGIHVMAAMVLGGAFTLSQRPEPDNGIDITPHGFAFGRHFKECAMNAFADKRVSVRQSLCAGNL